MSIRDTIFPLPLKVETLGGSVRLSGAYAEAAAEFALKAFLHAAEGSGLSADKDGNVRLVFDEAIDNEEGYAIEAADSAVTVRARSLAGFCYAGGSLSQIAAQGYIPAIRLYDEPLCKIRGVHMYLPPSDVIEDEFFRVLDLLARLKYNTVFLEIGGGVEYESHPRDPGAFARVLSHTFAPRDRGADL